MILSSAYSFLYISDIDECSEITDLCEHNCYNTNGSYVCDCKPGYMISDEGFFCSGKIIVYYHK